MSFLNVIFFRTIPMLLTAVISNYVFSKLDRNYRVSNKVRNVLNISLKREAVIYFCAAMLFIVFVGILGMYVNMNVLLYSILAGMPLGIVVYIGDKNRNLINGYSK